MTWPQAIFYSVLAICLTPVVCLFLVGALGIEFRWWKRSKD